MQISQICFFPANDDFAMQASQFLMKWTPRIIVAAFAGYYCLGFAYDWGIMAAIDRIAIDILKTSVGYAGLGAAMPTFQWYSAWAVRTIAAASAGLLYDLTERSILFVYHQFQDRYDHPKVLTTTDPPLTSITTMKWVRI